MARVEGGRYRVIIAVTFPKFEWVQNIQKNVGSSTEPSNLVLLQSSLDSSQFLRNAYCGNRYSQYLSWLIWLGAWKKKRGKRLSNHNSYPSRLSRPHLWSSRNPYYNLDSNKHQSEWTRFLVSFRYWLVLIRFYRGCSGSCQGSLVKREHLWQKCSKECFSKNLS